MVAEDVLDRLRLRAVVVRRRGPVRVDVPHSLTLDARPVQRRAHHLRDPDRVRVRLRHVVRVVRRPVGEDLRVDARTARLRALEVLEEEHARPLPHHETGSGRVERARGEGGILLLGDEPAHGAEAGEDERVHAGLGASCEHDVGVPAPDGLRTLPDRVRTRSRTRTRARSWGPEARGRSRSGRSRSRRGRSAGTTATRARDRALVGPRSARERPSRRRWQSRSGSPREPGRCPPRKHPPTPRGQLRRRG